jgi:general secretion pathway protein I
VRRRALDHGDTMETPQCGSVASGFTLLEMLVALAIFSLAALALVRLQGVSARTSLDLNARTMAQIVARNLMVERLTDPEPPALGASSGTEQNGGRTWPWIQQVEPSEDERMVIVTVRVDSGPGQSPAVLTFGRTTQ